MEPVETDEEEGTVFSPAAQPECCKYKYPGIVFPCPEVCCSEEREGWREEEEEKEEKEEEWIAQSGAFCYRLLLFLYSTIVLLCNFTSQ